MPARHPVRIAMLAHSFYLLDPRIRREAESLAEQGFDVHVIALSDGSREFRGASAITHNGVHIHQLPICKKRGNFLRYVYEYFMTGVLGGLKLAQLHLRGRLDVTHIHNMPDILIFAGLIPWLGGSKLILDVHDPMPELYMGTNQTPFKPVVWLLRLQEKFSCWLADRVISVNETMRENLLAKGVAEEKIFILHNFPDRTYFQTRDVPETWPKNPERLVLLYCGTITEHYDLGLAVRAMAKLKNEIPIHLKIIGQGNKLSEVLELASALGVRDSIEHVGSVPVEKVAEEMTKADVGISCHRGGIFGDLYFSTKIIEYLTQGLAVVSPRTYTIHKYLSDDCMFYFEPGNEAALVDTIRFIWHNPTEVLRRLTQARKHLVRFSWQAEKVRFLDFYTDLLNHAPAKARTDPAQ
jgi:glycosyltransferase involved in cell wall biosynthesis